MLEPIHGHGVGFANNIAERIVQNESESSSSKIQKLEILRTYIISMTRASRACEQRSAILRKVDADVAAAQRACDDDPTLAFDSEGIKSKYAAYVAELPAHDDAADEQAFEVQAVNKFIAALRPGGGGGDDDDVQEDVVATGPQQRVLRCPFLNAALIHPFVNTKCNHVYSKDGIVTYFALKFKGMAHAQEWKEIKDIPDNVDIDCPVAGCSTTITKAVLKRDYQTEVTQRQMHSSSRRDSMDVDDLS